MNLREIDQRRLDITVRAYDNLVKKISKGFLLATALHGTEKQETLEAVQTLSKQRSLLSKAAVGVYHHDPNYLTQQESEKIEWILHEHGSAEEKSDLM